MTVWAAARARLLHGNVRNDALNGGAGTDTCYQDAAPAGDLLAELTLAPNGGGGGGSGSCTPGYSPCIPRVLMSIALAERERSKIHAARRHVNVTARNCTGSIRQRWAWV